MTNNARNSSPDSTPADSCGARLASCAGLPAPSGSTPIPSPRRGWLSFSRRETVRKALIDFRAALTLGGVGLNGMTEIQYFHHPVVGSRSLVFVAQHRDDPGHGFDASAVDNRADTSGAVNDAGRAFGFELRPVSRADMARSSMAEADADKYVRIQLDESGLEVAAAFAVDAAEMLESAHLRAVTRCRVRALVGLPASIIDAVIGGASRGVIHSLAAGCCAARKSLSMLAASKDSVTISASLIAHAPDPEDPMNLHCDLQIGAHFIGAAQAQEIASEVPAESPSSTDSW